MITADIEQLFEQYGSVMQIEKDQYVFREGEQAKYIFFLVNGAIQINKNVESGKEMTLRLCGPHSLIGENSLYCPPLVYTTTAKAMHNSTLLSLPCSMLEKLLNEHPNMMRQYLQWVQIENLKNQSRIRDLLLQGKKGALYSTIIRLVNTYGQVRTDGSIFINFALTNTQIANLCATSREVVNRMLNELKKSEIITFNQGFITVLSLAYLKQGIACDNCPQFICRID